MKKMLMIVLLFTAVGCNPSCGSSCGYTSRNNELVGQVKKVTHETPLFCEDYDEVDLSLGVMRNGVGSYSTQDVWLVVTPEQSKQLEQLQRANAVVRVTYDTRRLINCVDTEKFARGVEDVTDAGM